MNRYQVKAALPIIHAFAEGRPVQYRERGKDGLFSDDWMTINPETSEFRLTEFQIGEWRVAPQPEKPPTRLRCNVRNMLRHAGTDAKFYRFDLEQLADNLKELHDRHRVGDLTAIDEFFELYIFDEPPAAVEG